MVNTKANVLIGGKFGINWQDSSSARGHCLAEVRSAVIKELRRGKEEDALFWALEMVEAGEQVARELWQDLRVFALEDVGLANPDALIQTTASQKLFDELPKSDGRRLLAIAHVVCYLARSSKTRYANEMLGVMLQDRGKGKDLPMPDYAVDLHTRRGRGMGRGFEHYLTVAAQLENQDEAFPDTYRDLALERSRKLDK